MLARRYSIVPGFGLTFGYTVSYLSLIVLIPLAGLFVQSSAMTWQQFWQSISDARVVASYRLTILCALTAAGLNAVFGFLVAWCLVRYRFPGRRIIDAFIDLPFALPTAVSGIVLTTVYSPQGWIGSLLAPLGIKVAYTPLGIIVALVFIGLPFVVRVVQPAIQDIDPELEEAASSLGASRMQTFLRVLLPMLVPAISSGAALAFARALGEYGSVIFIAGNMPMRTEITSLLIVTRLEQYDYAGATAIAVVMLTASFVMLLTINVLQWWNSRRYRSVP
ncbi:MAG TPA: sulfate ABC transporter permease subunit CysT [Bryobacteraceae bacterium]|jgi:sulfate transport system permease protein|nr:sulfate ABC transporter permease subunit CysT [Bryobacteraceae bacterium]